MSPKKSRWGLRVGIAVLVSALAIGVASPAWAVMTVYVRSLTGQTLTIAVESSDTVESLKQKIEDVDGTPVADQRLVYAGRQLQDGRTLADYNIQNSATIHVVRRLRTSSSSTDPAPEPIPMWFQAYARRVSTDSCTAGWAPSWAEWPNAHTGGWTCDREIPSLG